MDNVYNLMKYVNELLGDITDGQEQKTVPKSYLTGTILISISVIVLFFALVIVSIVYRYKYTKNLDIAQSENSTSFNELL